MPGIFLLATAETVPYNDFVVALLGIGTVFAGLVVIILLCKLLSLVLSAFSRAGSGAHTPAAPSVSVAEKDLSDEERGAVIAAVSAVIAEELGTDVSALRIRSFRKL